MKPVVIKADKVLEYLFKGDEVLHISFVADKRKVSATKLTECAIVQVKDIVENVGVSEFFVAITNEVIEEPEEPVTPPEETVPGEDKEEVTE